MRSRIRVPWERGWRWDSKFKSRSLQSWCKPPLIQSPSLLFLGGSTRSPKWWKMCGGAGLEERRERTRAEGVWAFYWPAHTGHVRYLWAGCFCSKNSFSWFQSPSLLLLSPKRYTILIQTENHQYSYPIPLIDFLFSKYLANLWFCLLKRDIVRHSRMWT